MINIKKFSIILSITLFACMLSINIFMINNFKSQENIYNINKEKLNAEAILALSEIEKNQINNFYKEIWTYNAIIFLGGSLIMYSLKNYN